MIKILSGKIQLACLSIVLSFIQIPLAVKAQSDSLVRFFSALSSPYFLKNTKGESTGYLYLEAKAKKYVSESTSKRLPLNICLVLDRSGSMSGEKIEYVRRTAAFVVDNLQSEDILSIVTYETNVEVEFSSSQILNKELIKNKIKKITVGGSTNLSGGLLEGYKQVKSTFKPGYVNRVLLLSDGLANVGITDPNHLNTIVSGKAKTEGITLSTFGVGADFNEDMMTNLAEYGSGNYYFIDSADKIPQLFDQELKGLISVVAQNMKLELILPQGVVIDQIFGYPYTVEKGILKIDYRDVFSEDVKGVLVRFKRTRPLADSCIFSSFVQFDDALTGQQKRLESKIINLRVTDSSLISKSMDGLVDNQIVLFEANEVLKEAALEADKGNYQSARNLISQNATRIKRKLNVGASGNKEILTLDSLNTKYEESLKDIENKPILERKMVQKEVKSGSYKVKTKRISK